MSVQVDLFNETIEKNLKKKFKTQSALSKHLAESLFMTAIGTNDYAFFYNKLTDAKAFANTLLHEFLIQIQVKIPNESIILFVEILTSKERIIYKKRIKTKPYQTNL